jgi:hypothetical protein
VRAAREITAAPSQPVQRRRRRLHAEETLVSVVWRVAWDAWID